MAKLIDNNGREFTFQGSSGRVYRIRFGQKLKPRNKAARGFDNGKERGHLTRVNDDGTGRPSAMWGTKPKAWTLLDSLEGDYDLTEFVLEGEARTMPMRSALVMLPSVEPAEDEAAPATSVAENTAKVVDFVWKMPDDKLLIIVREQLAKPPRGTIARADIAGLALEALTAPGDNAPRWVTLRSLFEPFGKRVDNQAERLEGWANLRTFSCPSQKGVGTAAENLMYDTPCIAWDQALAALLEMPVKGVPEPMLPGLIRFKQEGAGAIHAYFVDGAAVNPRAPVQVLDETAVALRFLGRESQEHGRRVEAVEARLESKADKADVDAVLGLATERAEARARVAAREEVAAALGDRAPPPVVDTDAAPDSSRSVRDLLEAASLPTEKQPKNPARFLFGDVAIGAIRRAADGGPVPKGTLRLTDAQFRAALIILKKATEEYTRLGWSVDSRRCAVAGRFRIETVIERMIEALRRPLPPQLTLVPGQAETK